MFQSSVPRQRGASLLQVVVALIVLFGFVALTVDYGAMVVRQRHLQTAADAAALAAGPALADMVQGDPTLAEDVARAYSQYNNETDVTALGDTATCSLTVTTRANVPTPFRGVLSGTSTSPVSAVAYLKGILAPKGVGGLRPLAFFAGPANGQSHETDKNVKNTAFAAGEAIISFQKPQPANTKNGFTLPGNKPAVTNYGGKDVNYYVMDPLHLPPDPGDSDIGPFTNYIKYLEWGYDGLVKVSPNNGDGIAWQKIQMFFDSADTSKKSATPDERFSQSKWVEATQTAINNILQRAAPYNSEGPNSFTPENPRLLILAIVNRDMWSGQNQVWDPKAKILGFTTFLIDTQGIIMVRNPAVENASDPNYMIPALHGWFVPYAIPDTMGGSDPNLEADEFSLQAFKLVYDDPKQNN